MHPDRVIVQTDSQSESISTRPDDQKTLTRQSAGTTNPPRDPLHVPVTWNPSQHGRVRSTSTDTSTFTLDITIFLNSKRSVAMSRARPLPRIIRLCEPFYRHHNFCTNQRL